MTVRFLGQSGYVLKTENTEIIIDPYLSDSVNRVANRPRTLPLPMKPEDISCDAVICTHNHLDHLDPDTVVRINENQFYITTNEGKEELERLGRTNVRALGTGGKHYRRRFYNYCRFGFSYGRGIRSYNRNRTQNSLFQRRYAF